MSERRMVPASEYDALIDAIRVLVSEYTLDTPEQAVDLIDQELGHGAAAFLRRILIDGDTSWELFAVAAASGRQQKP